MRLTAAEKREVIRLVEGRERITRRTLQRRKRENLHLPHHAAIRPEVSLRNGVQLSNLV